MTAKRIPDAPTVGEILDEMDAARLAIGGNNPPIDPPTPFEEAKKAIEDLQGEARLWLDGQAIANQAQADEVGRIIKGFRDAHKGADDARKVENEPFDTGKAEVQQRYNPVLKIAKDGEAMAKIAVAKFIDAQEKIRQDQAREARRIADEQAEAARQAIADANAAGNLAAREDAEQLVVEAAETAKLANALDKGRTMVATGAARRLALRTVYSAEITDRLELMRWAWRRNAGAFDELLLTLANDAIKGGLREIPGAKVNEEQKV